MSFPKPPPWQYAHVVAHCERLASSFTRWLRQDLLPGNLTGLELSRALYEAPFVLVSHGTEPDPVLNYGNRRAQELWELTWEELTRLPSRLTAEVPNREERARLLDQVTRFGFIDNYSGVRISKTGRRFRITRAVVWNLLDENHRHAGQAATFRGWRELKS